MTQATHIRIRPRSGWQAVDLSEVWEHRELLGFLVWRDIRIRYKQTALGALWAVLQPLIGMVVFGILLTRVAHIDSAGPEYSLFVLAGLVPWTFFANSVSIAGNSLIGNEQIIRKIYFPRILVPLAAILALGMDTLVSLVLLGIVMAIMRAPVSSAIVLLPVFLIAAGIAATGFSLFLAALNVKYRDIKYVVPFFTQMALFMTPVLYPLSRVSVPMQRLLSLNPMAGVIEGFHFAVFGSAPSWPLLAVSFAVSLLLLFGGLLVFKRMERSFADVI